MMVYLQWALSTPSDWIAVDIKTLQNVRSLPRKPAPTSPTQALDSNPGWVNAINVQGIIFHGYDWYSVEIITNGLRVSGWQDAPVGDRWATVWDLLTPASDGARMNTRQTRRCYAETNAPVPGKTNTWAQFVKPAANISWPGKQMSDSLYLSHMSRQTLHGWREWIEL